LNYCTYDAIKDAQFLANRMEESGMEWWGCLPEFWQGFICGGLAVPLVIVTIEIIVKRCLRRA
jgi:hypothetical protein